MSTPAGYNSDVECFRETQFPMLKDDLYLDHAGTTLYSKCLMERFSQDMMSNLLGNPHSLSSSSQLSASRVENVRLRLLTFFGADPADYDLVFVSNSTAAMKLVAEALRAAPGGFAYAYHQAAHTSAIGIREEAKTSQCLDDDAVEDWISGKCPLKWGRYGHSLPVLFAYAAQSHMDGRRYPLSWADRLRASASSASQELFVLLDAASYAATGPLKLEAGECAPDFVAVSLYKIFGFPDLGALIVKKSVSHVFRYRRYFGGGTVDMVACGQEPWHVRKGHFPHEHLEDGTLPIHNIIALDSALDVHELQFGSMIRIASHTAYLRKRLLDGLSTLRHYNGRPVCTVYSQDTSHDRLFVGAGPIIAFNLQDSKGAWVSLGEFEKLAGLKKVHIRTGGVCSPGGVAAALGLTPADVKNNFSSGIRCSGHHDVVAGKPTGIIRASLGAMSIKSDVDKFVQFISDFYCDREPLVSQIDLPAANGNLLPAQLEVKDVIIYPIKSCGGYHIPSGTPWVVRQEGLAWDREWCLVHQGSGQALAQKRYPKMALIKPRIDLANNLMQLSYQGERPKNIPETISVPLSWDPETCPTDTFRMLPSRVCGESITVQAYTSPQITNYFSGILGIPCILTRFPPGGKGRSTRSSKTGSARSSRGMKNRSLRLPGTFPGLPSPPESDSEPSVPILLSNESPILLIHTSSVSYINEVLPSAPVPPAQFRPNIVVGSRNGTRPLPAFSEESWRGISFEANKDKFRRASFCVLGKCYRCQMVCVDQDTGERGEEPFVTLTRTRRVDGKVPFGVHICLEAALGGACAEQVTITVADSVCVDAAD
ncbi:hypothetical protein jhhlp_007317 [Lomentospora prolificans]|uniref:Molybdenum cofactor sulfurase n=1 Tax=Lomentospora prolificans TaxID=41688 RepID=A0A2N3N2B5_9PEZI|nr:hypothetical protein jhhlp_007317 [Lomentospora prolificans]